MVTAEVNIKGNWQKVIITDKESEYLYKVHYLELPEREDEWISLAQIKNIDSAAAPVAMQKEIKITSAATCSFKTPAAPVSNTEKFSEKVARRKVYEYLLSAKAGIKTGISYLYFQQELPYINTVSVSESKTLVFRNAAAPAGSMIYPVRAKYKICEEVSGVVSTQIVDGRFSCYRNKNGFWECK